MKLLRIFGFFAILAFVLLFPVAIAPNTATNAVAVFTLIGAITVVGWNIFSGYTGYISLGHSVFYGFGAYTIALASQDWNIPGGWGPFVTVPLAGLVAGGGFPPPWLGFIYPRRPTLFRSTPPLLFLFSLSAPTPSGNPPRPLGVFLS